MLFRSSVYADLKNTSGADGSLTKSATFLNEFVTKPWVHLDIAGTAYFAKPNPWAAAGATGVSHAMLVELALAGAEAFVVPAGFTMATGRDHWEVLLRARAIENAAYVIAANQHGFWDGSARYARSMIIDPWGVVLANAGDGEGICVAAIDRARVAEVRRLIPVFSARRPEAYRLG